MGQPQNACDQNIIIIIDWLYYDDANTIYITQRL